MQVELADNYSLVNSNKIISKKEQESMFKNVATFDLQNTYDLVIKKDLNQMTGTVHDEIKDTLGLPRPPRKIAPVKEAKKRLAENEKSIKQ